MKPFLKYCKDYRNASVFIFGLAFLGYVFLGLCISYPVTMEWFDVFFGTDSVRVFRDMTNITFSHQRIKVHPLFLLVVQPVTLCLDGIVNYPAMTVILEEAFCGAVSVSIFYKILDYQCIEKKIRILFTIIYGLSFSCMILSTVPETFIFAGAGLISYWYFIVIASDGNGPLCKKELFLLIFWGIISFGITLTNYISYVIGLIYLLACRYNIKKIITKFFQINLENAVCLIGLCFFQKRIWKNCPLFWTSIFEGLSGMEYEETRYMNWDVNLTKTISWAKQVFFLPLISSDVYLPEPDSHKIYFGGYSDGVVKGLLGFACMVFCGCILIHFIRVVHKNNIKEHGYFLGLLAAYCGNLALHYVYGSKEAFMYSAHFLFLFLLLAAISFNSIKRKNVKKLIGAGLVSFCVVEGVCNLQQFFETTDLALGLVDSFFYPIHSIKGTFLCAVIMGMLYLCWMYGNWVKREGSKKMLCGQAESNINRFCATIAVYMAVVGIVGLFVAFNYAMY